MVLHMVCDVKIILHWNDYAINHGPFLCFTRLVILLCFQCFVGCNFKYCYCVNLCCRIYLFSICCTFCYSYFPCSSAVKMSGIKLIAWHCICKPSCDICLKSLQEVLTDDIRWYKYCILELVLVYIYLKLKSTSYKSHTIKKWRGAGVFLFGNVQCYKQNAVFKGWTGVMTVLYNFLLACVCVFNWWIGW